MGISFFRKCRLYVLCTLFVGCTYSQPSEMIWHLIGTSTNRIGNISWLGDMNQDGYGDISVRRYHPDDSISFIFIYFGGNPMDTLPDFIFPNSSTGRYDIQILPNLNGDNLTDFHIGRDLYHRNQFLTDVPTLIMPEGVTYQWAGDVNNDGFSDLIAQRQTWYSAHEDIECYIEFHYGGPNMDTTPEFSWTAPGEENLSFNSMNHPPYFNGDTIRDVYLRTLTVDENGSVIDTNYFYYGPDINPEYPDTIIPPTYSPDSTIKHKYIYIEDLTGDGFPELYSNTQQPNSWNNRTWIMNGAPPYNPEVISEIYRYGFVNSGPWSPGDVNGDGYNDLILSGYLDSGMLLYLGGPDMRASASAIWHGYSWDGLQGFGSSGSKVGDINGDGINDIGVTAQDTYDNPYGDALIFAGDPDWVNPYVVAAVNDSNNTPSNFRLYSPYPNPFNPVLKIPFNLNKPGKFDVKIYNLNGQCIKTLFSGIKAAGTYELKWIPHLSPSGIYIVQFESNDFIENRKVLLLK